MLLPHDANSAWKFVWFLLFLLRPLFCRLEITGRENVPKDGGVVIACNHPGGTDVLVLGYASPRQIHYMAKQELFQVNWLLSALLRAAGAFPVRRGHRDVEAVGYSIDLVRRGKVLGMFPEGTRNRGQGMKRGRTGAVRIAAKANVCVVPAAITGIVDLHRSWHNPLSRPRITVQFGEPIRLPDTLGNGAAYQEQTDRIMLAVASMLPPELRGVYSDQFADTLEGTPEDATQSSEMEPITPEQGK